jgi:hypothetical protein
MVREFRDDGVHLAGWGKSREANVGYFSRAPRGGSGREVEDGGTEVGFISTIQSSDMVPRSGVCAGQREKGEKRHQTYRGADRDAQRTELESDAMRAGG